MPNNILHLLLAVLRILDKRFIVIDNKDRKERKRTGTTEVVEPDEELGVDAVDIAGLCDVARGGGADD